MNIAITEEAKKFIEEKGKELVISTAVVKGCCGAMVKEPLTTTKLPEGVENYQKLDCEGITVYLPPKLEIDEAGLKVRLSGFWRWRYLSVEGVKSSF